MQGAYTTCFKLVLHHNMLNNLLPMRAGEITFPVLMSRYFNVAASKSVPVLLWFRLLDLHTLLTIAIMVMGVVLFNLFIASLCAIVWLMLPFIIFRLNKVLLSKLDHQSPNKLTRLIVKGLHSLPQSNTKFYRSWGWTWLNWLLKLSVSSWIILLFLDTSISIAYMGSIMGDLTSVLPVYGVAGFGTYEAGILAGLLPFENIAGSNIAKSTITGDYKENALQAAIYLHLIILGSAITGGLIATLLPGKQPASHGPNHDENKK